MVSGWTSVWRAVSFAIPVDFGPSPDDQVSATGILAGSILTPALLHPLRPRFSHLRPRAVFLLMCLPYVAFLCRMLNTGGCAWETFSLPAKPLAVLPR